MIFEKVIYNYIIEINKEMNTTMNSAASNMIYYQRVYNTCLATTMDDFLSKPTAGNGEAEWCKQEKAAYMNHMKDHLPT